MVNGADKGCVKLSETPVSRVVRLLPVLALLCACDAGESSSAVSELGIEIIAQREIHTDTFAITVSPQSSPEGFLMLAKETCGARAWCRVMIWDDDVRAPRGFPMTDHEVEAERFNYIINRRTGFERALWDCENYPDIPADSCLGKG